VAGLVV